MTAARQRFAVRALAALTLFVSRDAWAASMRVALHRPSPSDPALGLALTRLEGELVADGFDVVLVQAPTPVASELGEEESGAAASIVIGVDRAARTAELTVVDRLTHKSVVRQIAMDEVDDAKAAKILAVRAVELLRASLLELLIESSAPAAAPSRIADSASRQASGWARRALRPEEQAAWAIEVGTALHLEPAGGIGPALVGVLRVRRALGRAFTLRAGFAGVGTEANVTAPAGAASVSQVLGLLEMVTTPWSNLLVRPIFSFGVGVLSTTVDAQAAVPYVGHKATQLSLAVDAGLGVVFRLSQRFELALEAHALTARPYPSVRFLGVEVARADVPSFFGSMTVASFL